MNTASILGVEDFDTLQEAIARWKVPVEVHRCTSLLDLTTPGLDGRDALREVRSDRRFASLPIIVLSTSASPRDVVYCYATGANAYHTKPTSYVDPLEMLRELFAYWLGRVRLSAARGSP